MFGKCLWFLLQLQLTENKCHWNKCYQSVIQNQSKYCWGPANRSNALDWIRLDLPGLFQDCSLVMHVLAETVICCQFGPFIWSIMDSQSEQNAGDIPCSSFLVVWLFPGCLFACSRLGWTQSEEDALQSPQATCHTAFPHAWLPVFPPL